MKTFSALFLCMSAWSALASASEMTCQLTLIDVGPDSPAPQGHVTPGPLLYVSTEAECTEFARRALVTPYSCVAFNPRQVRTCQADRVKFIFRDGEFAVSGVLERDQQQQQQ